MVLISQSFTVTALFHLWTAEDVIATPEYSTLVFETKTKVYVCPAFIVLIPFVFVVNVNVIGVLFLNFNPASPQLESESELSQEINNTQNAIIVTNFFIFFEFLKAKIIIISIFARLKVFFSESIFFYNVIYIKYL